MFISTFVMMRMMLTDDIVQAAYPQAGAEGGGKEIEEM